MSLKQVIATKTIIPLAEFDKFKIQFTCKNDPLSNGPLELTYTKENFIELDASTPILFKLAVHESY